MVSITQPWRCRDGRWFLPHFNLPHLEKKVLDVLGCEGTPEAVAEAVRKWNSEDLDRAIYEAGATGGISLAEHGADVLMVTAPQLPQVPNFVRDVSHGKRSCYLDYNVPGEAQKIRELTKGADIFLEGYRPGSMERHGFSPEEVAAIKSGIIYVSIDCFGPGGAYSDRAGWDQVAQAVTGIAVTEGKLEGNGEPKLTPVYACDFLTGFLGAFGAMLALRKRAEEGGSWKVHVSLCQSAMLLQREGLMDQVVKTAQGGIVSEFDAAPGRLPEDLFEEYAVCDDETIYGDLKTLGPVIRMSETNPRWNGTTPELGSSEPVWL